MDETENALVALARRGEATALLALWYRYEGALCGIARKYRGVSYEDALQEARTAFWVCVLEYDETRGVPFGAYVWRKVRGYVRTAMRRLWTAEGRLVRPSRSPEGDIPALWDTAVDGMDPTAGVDDTLAAAELVQAAGLSPRESLAIRLWLDGWSMADIAQREGVSVETVKTWRKRALAKLRRSASKVAVGVCLGGKRDRCGRITQTTVEGIAGMRVVDGEDSQGEQTMGAGGDGCIGDDGVGVQFSPVGP